MEENKKPEWLQELYEIAPPDWTNLLSETDGVVSLVQQLKESLPADEVSQLGSESRRIWELFGLYYRGCHRWRDAIGIYSSMYTHFLEHQLISGERIHKGMPLLWMADCYLAEGFTTISKRYLMLTLIEDAITGKGTIKPKETGVYFRLNWRHGLTDEEIKSYSQQVFPIYRKNPKHSLFPEWVLQELDQDWLVEIPSPNEAAQYVANTTYAKYLISNLGESTGRVLEKLAEYVLSCIPGCRTARRLITKSTDYDIVCSIDGIEIDFRSEFGRYFVCECKDWKNPVDYSSLAKFCRVLDSVKARFGILFSSQGITGEKTTENAKREQLKVFQDRGMVIVVITKKDIEYVADGGNFIGLLRKKYEKVRLDLN
jgi:hypothetical protein